MINGQRFLSEEICAKCILLNIVYLAFPNKIYKNVFFSDLLKISACGSDLL